MDAFKQWLGKTWDCLLRRPTEQALPVSDGQLAERLAEKFLRQKGLTILARNVRCKGGEIDLIALEGTTLVFVEVRLRQNADFGGAAASITRPKQKRIILAARHWLHGEGRRYARHPCRFDALLLNDLTGSGCKWIRAAFMEAH
ncbi:YraN family protein [Uliginosibacterium gangwonense]|uniref:YraN family protein n=1 Tax=Uliginosibacterium gangwonense TaxID=392736 RepID=UPI00036BB827|nr:YraN family protein [Uliginosibacterium gangwonense]